ncbi:hypothetical protein BC829DRAFT_264761 [Chytridium lagenaria]|nr:hypothetical protein BC829DRAFT_264761 [Chytridium lagenaria]
MIKIDRILGCWNGMIIKPGSKKRKRTKPEAPPVENLNGLGMVDAYASSDDGSSDGCEMEAEAPAEGSAKLPSKSPRPKSICRYFAKGHCRMGKRCNFTHEKPVKEDLDKTQPHLTRHKEKKPSSRASKKTNPRRKQRSTSMHPSSPQTSLSVGLNTLLSLI